MCGILSFAFVRVFLVVVFCWSTVVVVGQRWSTICCVVVVVGLLYYPCEDLVRSSDRSPCTLYPICRT